MSEIELTAQQAALYPACVHFVAEQSEGEWTQELIYSDAKKLAVMVDEVRTQARAEALSDALKACKAAQYSPAPYTDIYHAIRTLSTTPC